MARGVQYVTSSLPRQHTTANCSYVNPNQINQNRDNVHKSLFSSLNLCRRQFESCVSSFQKAKRLEWKERPLNGIKVKGGKNTKLLEFSSSWVSPDSCCVSGSVHRHPLRACYTHTYTRVESKSFTVKHLAEVSNERLGCQIVLRNIKKLFTLHALPRPLTVYCDYMNPTVTS